MESYRQGVDQEDKFLEENYLQLLGLDKGIHQNYSNESKVIAVHLAIPFFDHGLDHRLVVFTAYRGFWDWKGCTLADVFIDSHGPTICPWNWFGLFGDAKADDHRMKRDTANAFVQSLTDAFDDVITAKRKFLNEPVDDSRNTKDGRPGW